MKLQQMKDRNYFLTIPKDIVRAKEWHKGDKIVAKIDKEGNILLKKVSTHEC